MSTGSGGTSRHHDAGQLYEQVVACIDGIVWEADAQTFQISFVSRQAERLLGYPLDQWYQPGFWADHLHPDDRDWAVAFCLRAAREKRKHDFEYRMRAADGRTVWLRDIVSVVVEGGEAAKLCGVMVDQTERKKTEEALRESEKLYRLLTENSNDLIYLVDLEGRIIYASPSVGRLLGRVPRHTFEVVHPEDVEAGKAYWERILAGERGLLTVRVADANDAWHWLEAWSSLIDYQGQPHVLSVCRDVTERKRSEEQLRASLREKEALLKEVHHRVKNNLQLVTSLINLQAAQIPDPAAREQLAEFRNRVRSMALVHENLYRTDSFVGVPLARPLRGLCDHLLRSYAGEGTRIELDSQFADTALDLDRAIPCVLIFNELVTNALKHAFPDGRAGRVSVQFHALAGGRCALVVADDGVGLPAGLDPNRPDSLGLRLVADLAEQLHGTVAVARGGGTTFTITFTAPGGGDRQS